MSNLHFDCFSGISGDMTLGALVDLGVPIGFIEENLKKIKLSGYKIRALPCKRNNISATKVHVDIDAAGLKNRIGYPDMRGLILNSKLDIKIKEASIAVIEKIVKSEASVHGISVEELHLHEVGAVDTIIDVVGAVTAIKRLNPHKITSSPVNLGNGTVNTEHGLLPVPAPATAEILKGFPCFTSNIMRELTTPTGAAIVTTLAHEFGNFNFYRLNNIGYGAGDAEIKGSANLLRLLSGEGQNRVEKLSVIETNIDDMVPEFYDHIYSKLFDKGVLDVFITPIQMKKNRPAVKLTVLLKKEMCEDVSSIIFKETSTLGIRIHEVGRLELNREILYIKTRFGDIKVKIGRKGEEVLNIAPEYESYQKAAQLYNRSIKEVYAEAVKEAVITLRSKKK